VVDFGDRYETHCVEFTESEITGYDVLRRAGLNLVIDPSNPMGVTVCDINNTSGCPASNCFCQCQGSPCVYWSYHYLADGSWRYSQLGASNRKVHDGDVEGWGWGEGKINTSGQEPPVIPFKQICSPPATDTPVPTNTPVPPTPTPIPPTDTPAPTDTPGATTVPSPDAWFRLDENPIPSGSCTMLRWDTSNAQEVTLDGDGVGINGSREVCPTAPTDYVLRVVGLEEEATFRLTLGVTGSAATATTAPQATAAPPSPTVDDGATSLPASPTPQGTATSSPSPTTSAPSAAATPTTSEPKATASLPPSEPASPSPSVTAAQITQAQPTATPAQVAEAQDSEDQSVETTEDQAASAEEEAPSLLPPIGTIAFSLIVGGLLGWLIYILRFRGRRA
jgi:hypothetical protein